MKVGHNDFVEVHGVSEYDFRQKQRVMLHDRVHPDQRAELAMRLLTHREISVITACEAAEAAFEEFERRGWLVPVPTFEALTPNDAQD